MLNMGNVYAMNLLFLFLIFFPFSCLQGKVPLLPLEGLHHLHIFIFVLAIVHVTFSVLTVVFGGAKVVLIDTFLTCFTEGFS